MEAHGGSAKLFVYLPNPNCLSKPMTFQISSHALDPPVVTLQLGSTLSIDDIKEGDDIYFECKIQSNPAWRRLSWLHNVSV